MKVSEGLELAAKLYQAYGEAKNWTRSSGEPMEQDMSALPLDCVATWCKVAGSLTPHKESSSAIKLASAVSVSDVIDAPNTLHVNLALAVLHENGVSLEEVTERYSQIIESGKGE